MARIASVLIVLFSFLSTALADDASPETLKPAKEKVQQSEKDVLQRINKIQTASCSRPVIRGEGVDVAKELAKFNGESMYILLRSEGKRLSDAAKNALQQCSCQIFGNVLR